MGSEGDKCACYSLGTEAIVPMRGHGLDEKVFATLRRVEKHGGRQWWLYLSRCEVCGWHWMVAQDERIHDNFYLKRLDMEAVRKIRIDGDWPTDFLTYEQVLLLGIQSGRFCRFEDSQSPALVATAADLREERPGITVNDIAYLLAIAPEDAEQLL